MQAGKPLFQYTLRELALCMVIAGLAMGWILDRHRLQGHLHHTNNPLDLAIDGEGFFQITDHATSSLVYTRHGAFFVDANGLLAVRLAGDEWLIDPTIAVPDDTVGLSISPDGFVLSQVSGKPQLQPIGQLQLSTFDDPSKLRRVANAIYSETAESGSPRAATPGTYGTGRVLQGVLDRRSNGLFGMNW